MRRAETESPTLEDAIALAAQAHRGQIYPSLAGEPYILHPIRVLLRLDSTLEQIVAALHDVVEDTAYTLDDLRWLGYPDDVIDALDRLTHRAEETYEVYIRRLQDHPLARRVKLADLAENLANNRGQEPDAERVARIARYAWAQAELLAAAGAVGGSVGSSVCAGTASTRTACSELHSSHVRGHLRYTLGAHPIEVRYWAHLRAGFHDHGRAASQARIPGVPKQVGAEPARLAAQFGSRQCS